MAQPLSSPAPAPVPDAGKSEAEDEAELVARAQAGETTAFETLVLRYQALVNLVAYRQLGTSNGVEDLAQEAFVKAFTHLHSLDDPHRFKSWLLRITANLALDQHRRARRPQLSLDQTGALALAEAAAAKQPPATDSGPEAAAALRQQIAEAIYALPEEYHLPAAMRYLEELSYREMSRRLGLRQDTLRKRIHRANQMLRRKLKALDLDEP